MKWVKVKHGIIGICHRATLGKGELQLEAYIRRAGGLRHFNWWVTSDNDDYMGESRGRLEGGTASLKLAKEAIEKAMKDHISAMRLSLSE